MDLRKVIDFCMAEEVSNKMKILGEILLIREKLIECLCTLGVSLVEV